MSEFARKRLSQFDGLIEPITYTPGDCERLAVAFGAVACAYVRIATRKRNRLSLAPQTAQRYAETAAHHGIRALRDR